MVFKQVGNDTDSLINKFGLLNKSFANIKKDFQSGQGLRSFGNIVSKQDLTNFEKFQQDLQRGVSYHKAFNNNLANSHTYIQQQAVRLRELNAQQKLLGRQLKTNKITQEEYHTAMSANQAQIKALTTKTQTLTLAQRASAVASKAAVVALNMLGNIAIMTAVNLIITGITKLVNKQKELRESISETAKEAKEQTDTLNDLIKSYEEFADKTSYTAEEKEKLKSIQEQLSESYHTEVSDIDLVNGKYDEQIEKLRELKKEKLQNAELSLVAERNQATKDSSYQGLTSQGKNKQFLITADWFKSEEDYNNIINEFDEKLKYAFSTDIAWASKWAGYDSALNFTIGNVEDRVTNLQTAMNILKDYGYSNIGLYSELNKLLSEYQGIADTASEATRNLADNMFQQYELDNPYNKVGKESYLAWKDGLLATAEGDDALQNELLSLAEQQFPDYAKYFNNLDLAKSMFTNVNSTFAEQKSKFLDSLSPEDLEIATQIPDLFADGLEGATAKIEAWKADPKNKITPDVEVDDTEISAMLETVSKKVKLITSAMEEQADTGYISSSTYADIIEMGGNFADCLEVQNGKLKLNVEKLKDLETQEYKNAISANELAIAQKSLGISSQYDYNEWLKFKEQLEKENAIYQTLIDEIYNAKPNESDGGGKEEKPDSVVKFEEEYARRQHEINMGRMSEDEDYYKWLESAAKTAFEGLEDYQDDLWKYEEEVYKGRKQLLEDYYDTQQKYLEDRIDSLEAQVDVTLNTSTTSDGTELITKEKYEYIKDTYQEIINEIETFKNEIINNGIEGHEELVAELEKQVEEYQQKIEDTFRTAVEEEKDYIEKLKDSYIDSYDERIDKIKEQKEAAEEAIQAEIDALKKVNDEKQRTNDLEKAKQKLENAKKQRTRAVLNSDGTMTYQVDQDKIDEAQQEYDEAMLENQIAILEEQKEIQSNGYNDLIENLENEQEAGERRFDILLKVLDEYLNPDNTTSNSDVWSKLAKMQGAKYENGTWYDKDGKAIDVENLVKSAETKTDDKKKAETDNSKSETDSALKKFLTNMEKQFNLKAGSLTPEKVQQIFGNSSSMNYDPYSAMKERTGLTGNEYASYINNENANITSTFNGDININNPVGNSNDLAQELIKNLPSAINRQTHKS